MALPMNHRIIFQNGFSIALIVLLIYGNVCLSQNDGQNNVHSNEYTSVEISSCDKKYLNFLTELPLGENAGFSGADFSPAMTNQEVYELDNEDKNTCAFAFDRHRYAYIGCNISPARIVKFDLAEMKRVSSIDLPSGENRDQCRVAALIAIRPDIIIHASFTNPCVFTRIDGNTMKITGTLAGQVEKVNDKYIRGLTYDGKYVYAANYSWPGKIIKIDPETMKKVDEVTFDTSISDITAITICGHYIIGVCGRDNPDNASIFRIDLNNIHQTPDLLNIPDYSRYQSVCTDGQSIYAATFTNPIHVIKVNALTSKLEFVSAFTGITDEEAGNFSIVYDGVDIIVGTWQLDSRIQDKLIKLDTNNLTRKSTKITPCKFPADIMYLEPYIYTCCDKPTGVILRMKN